jgi:hypothetical protein
LKYHQNKTRKYIFNVLHVRKRNLKKHYITKHNSDSDSDIGVVLKPDEHNIMKDITVQVLF